MQEKIEQVVPLKKDMAEAQATASAAKAKLDIALKEYYKIMEEVNMYRSQRDTALAEAKELTDKLGRFELQLGNSDSLTSSLAEEYDRWNNNVATIKEQITNLIGDVFIAASALSY
jgi:chromosome segregation ATPase